MEENRQWRLNRCCCLPLRSGILSLAYFNATVVFYVHLMGNSSPAIDNVAHFITTEFDIDIEQTSLNLYIIPVIVEYIFALILIYALHKNHTTLLFAYMCYVVVYVSCDLLMLLTYFSYIHLVYVAVDTLYYIYVLLLVRSVMVGIRLDKSDLLTPTQQASDVNLRTTAPPPPLAQPNKMADDLGTTSV